MAIFTETPDFATRKKTEPSVSKIKFGDGYEQRVAYGINTSPRIWNVRFANRLVTEIDAIEEFFQDRNGVEAFEWTPPRESTAVMIVCSSWDRSFDNPQTDTISATFEQVFEP